MEHGLFKKEISTQELLSLKNDELLERTLNGEFGEYHKSKTIKKIIDCIKLSNLENIKANADQLELLSEQVNFVLLKVNNQLDLPLDLKTNLLTKSYTNDLC